jgi:predicted dehydrogenase
MADGYRVGMVGYMFMGRTHGHAYRDIPMFFPESPQPELVAVAGRNQGGAQAFADQFGVGHVFNDWRAMVESDQIDIVDIASPGDTHHEIAIAAAKAGKHVLCEKPLANSLADANAMLDAVRSAGVAHSVIFNYRYCPAVQLAHKLIREGRLGKLFHIRAQFLQDWIVDPEFPLVWRLRRETAGSGALGDLGAHIIDMARFLVGEFEEVSAATQTFITERPLAGESSALSATAGSGEKGQVTVDDAAVFIARMRDGVLGTFEATRFAPGHRCTNAFEVNGSNGSVRFDFERMNELEVFFRDDPGDVQGFRTINVNDGAHPYGGRWWPPGHGIGYDVTFIHQIVDFLESIGEQRSGPPTFDDGVRCQAVLDAVERSARDRAWTALG